MSAGAVVEAALAAHRDARPGAQRIHRGHRRARPRQRRRRSMQRARRDSRSGRWRACRSRSRTCSTSPACRRLPARRSTATRPPAPRDAALIERLEAAGAVLVGALNMGEYAYDFTGENIHDGPSRNPARREPHDRRLVRRLGRRGRGPAGAAGARLRHQRLDPGAVLALRPVRPQADLWAAVARAHASRSWRASIISGRWRATPRDLALAYDAMQGPDPDDPVCADRAGRADAAATRAGHRRPAHRDGGRLFPATARDRSARSRSIASPRRSARRPRGRDSGGRAGTRRRLCDHRHRRRGRCISTACANAPMISTRRCATG